MPTLHGVNLSPFVRKVRITLAEKGIEYDQIPVLPFGQTEAFLKISPLGKIPVWQDEAVTVPDSSVIIDYLDRIHPEPALYPGEPALRARALWFEEYADTRLVEGLTTVFFQRFVNPRFMNKETDEALVAAAMNEKLPPVFDYLEGQIGENEYLVGGRFSIADIATTSPFVNFAHAGEKPDAARWPRLASYVANILARPAIKPIVEEEMGG